MIEQENTLGYILLHIRRSIPYTQKEVAILCDITLYRYRLFEKNKATPTDEEWSRLCVMFFQCGTDIRHYYTRIQ